MNQIDISIIIVSYKTVDLISECLDSVLSQGNLEKEIFVVDNASGDGTALLVQNKYPMVQLIENNTNIGFSKANNLALKRAQGDFVFFLNPDARMKKDCLSHAIRFMQKHPNIGLAGTSVLDANGNLTDSKSLRYPGEKYSSGELTELPGEIACVLGASMISRREILEKIKGFDEDYFLYSEDEDLCLRIRQSGYLIGLSKSCQVKHLGAKSERSNSYLSKWKKKVRSEFLFYRKHYQLKTIKKIRQTQIIKSVWRLTTMLLTLELVWNQKNCPEKFSKYLCYLFLKV